MVETLRSSGDTETIGEFTALLRQHVRKEEGVLFEEMQRLLPRDQLDNIGKLLR
jgi:hemerythrin-like domain-containing protein